MSSITVLGGTGYGGAAVVREAARRGHSVTSYSRRAPEHPVDDVTYEVRSALEPGVLDHIVDSADVVFVAVSPRGDMAGRVEGLLDDLITRAADRGVRVGVLGGASSLLMSPGGPRLYDVHPSAAEIRDEVDTGLALLEALRAAPADLDWFYVSPPRDFGAWAPAPTTGSYRLSDDVLLVDDEGGSTISADDLALAVLDEVVPQPRPTSAPPNSLDAAAGFNALRNAAPEREAELLSAIQRAWYRDGHSLSDPATYAQIARGFGLDGDAVAADAASQAARDQARREFTTADELGVHECPTLLLTVDGDTRRLGGPVTKAEPLIQQFETAVAGSA